MSEKVLKAQRISLDHHVLDSFALHPSQTYDEQVLGIDWECNDVVVIWVVRHHDVCEALEAF